MSQRTELPFESIEDAQSYIRLLAETVAETKGDIDREITLATEQRSFRRLQALRMVEYNLEKLQRYLSLSGRALNGLRSLRRLLLGEIPDRDRTKRHQVGSPSPLAGAISISEAPPLGKTQPMELV
jgi:hypothetical protein